MGKNKDAAIGFVGIAVIIAIIVGVVLVVFPEEPQTTQNELEQIEPDKVKLDTEEKVLEFMKNYKGKDNSGLNLFETMEVLMNSAYPDENVILSPSTKISFLAIYKFDIDEPGRYWGVELKIQTYRENIIYKWLVDTDARLIYPENEDAKIILDVLDTFDE